MYGINKFPDTKFNEFELGRCATYRAPWSLHLRDMDKFIISVPVFIKQNGKKSNFKYFRKSFSYLAILYFLTVSTVYSGPIGNKLSRQSR